MTDLRINRTVIDRPGFEIFSGGTQLGNDFAVRSVVVSKSVNRIPTARLVLEDGDVATQDFQASNSNELLPGAEIEIKMGYRNDYETVFKGIVIKHGIKTQQNERSLLTLELKDTTIKMTIGRKNKYFKDATDSDIIEEILSGYDFETEIEATAVNQAEMVQYYCTDWDFIVTRAEANGMLVFVNDGTVSIKPPDLSERPTLNLSYGNNIYEFDTEIDARDQFAGVKSNAWDFGQQEMIFSEASDPGFPEQGNISNSDLAEIIGLENLPFNHSGSVNSEELQSWADARLLRSKLAKVRGRIRINGINGIVPGNVVEISGMGDRFNGTAFVSSVGHFYGPGAPWYTDLEIGLSQEWLIEHFDNVIAKPSASLVPGINGLQIGIVTGIHDDPDGEDRIQIKLPVVDPDDDGIWARVASLDAGENRGTFFRPEIGDEVIVGFINDDPRDAVVLGMLNSSAKPAPIVATEDNNEKGFITREQLKLLFDDDKKSVTLETPNGNKAVLNDDEGSIILEDENGNKMTMDSSGITLESASDLTIKASGDITMESGTDMTLSAGTQFKSEGAAGAEISSGAMVTVQGSVVQIN